MDKLISSFWVIGIIMVFGACSSSTSTEDADFEDGEFEEEYADTDDVPEDSLEGDDYSDEEFDSELENEESDEFASDQDAEGTETSVVESSFTSTSSGQYVDYSIRQGDTLMSIAFEQYGDLNQWKRIYDTNQAVISDPNLLVVGTSLKIEQISQQVAIDRNGEKYLIKRGDTLGTISAEVYGSPSQWRRLWENNPQLIKDPNKIYAGFYLYYVLTPEDRQNTSISAPLAQKEPKPTTVTPSNENDENGWGDDEFEDGASREPSAD